MPNIIRRPRSRQPERRHNRACDPGTHLTFEERRRIYCLLQRPGFSQRAVASTLQLPRTTVQSAIYAMSKTGRMQQNHKQTPTTLVPDSAPVALSSSSTVCMQSVSNTWIQMQTIVQQPSLRHFTSAAPMIPPIATSTLDDHYRLPSQPAEATYTWDNHQLENVSIECSNLQRFGAHEGAMQTSLPRWPLKLTPMEPRANYKSV